MGNPKQIDSVIILMMPNIPYDLPLLHRPHNTADPFSFGVMHIMIFRDYHGQLLK